MRRNPHLNMLESVRHHVGRDNQLKNYMTTKRGRPAIDDASADTLKDSAALSLKANATLARIEFARALSRQVEKHAKSMSFPSFVTLAPSQFAVPIAEASRFDVGKLIEWAKKALTCRNHITFVEAALYTNYQAQRGGAMGAVHWHTHSICWGGDEEFDDEQMLFDLIEAGEQPFIPGIRLYHRRLLSAATVVGRTIYMAKAPLSEYRVYAQTEEKTDPRTGEMFKTPTGQYIQKKRALRPGDASLLCRIIGTKDLPSLTLAKGEGEELLKTATEKARLKIAKILSSLSTEGAMANVAPEKSYFDYAGNGSGWRRG